jgi:serine O-acetyltransferase
MDFNTTFLQSLVNKHQQTDSFPPTSEICQWVSKLLLLLFPEQTQLHINTIEDANHALMQHEQNLLELLKKMSNHLSDTPESIANAFMLAIPNVYDNLQLDVQAILNGDPAARSEFEVVRAYPGFYAISFYRVAHELHKLNIPILPRVITEFAHSKTGIDIHPGAQIGKHFYIDHGTGIVIGETAVIGDDVKIYQGVTLGALSVSKDKQDKKRHPTIENHVIIYSGATILGGDTIIGAHSIIGGNVWLTESVEPYTKAFHKPQIEVSIKKPSTSK